MTDLRYCWGDSEECREPKPASEFWRGSKYCRSCRKEAQRVKRREYERKWYANKKATDPEWYRRYHKRNAEAYRRRFKKPEKADERKEYWRKRYRHNEKHRAKRLAEAREAYAAKNDHGIVCGAQRARNRGFCTDRTRHPSGKCKWHRDQAMREAA